MSTPSQNFSEIRTYTIAVPRISCFLDKVKIICTIVATTTPTSVRKPVNVKLSISPNRHDVFLKTEYEHLFESGKYSDITFVINKQKLQLHKSILSSRSVVFSAMFDHDFKENSSNTVYIDDQTFEVMREFFRYVYCAKVNDMENHMVELLMTSNKYAIDGLKLLCEQSLIGSLKIQNALEFLALANRYRAKNLETQCLKFIAANAKEIVKLPTFDINEVPKELRNHLFKAAIETGM
ncbi:hypothetical protein QAD02_016620 [Eretmocerus hayati]|uniref:Uncharacterized protein n=1 Tax=Eretmocerus hayati TaxID=131215 RepID=A0ACC2PCN4_9HYME|nr:hypothetical protein QAD02_016620 [Eretmocerus hayati]